MEMQHFEPAQLDEIGRYVRAHITEWLPENVSSGYSTLYQSEVRERIVRVEEELKHLHQELKQQRELMREGFERMDKRFEHVEKRFEQVDKRLEQVDRRFDSITQRIDRIMMWSLGIALSTAVVVFSVARMMGS